jgi:hypothetical protein
VFKEVITVGLSALALLIPANGDASEARAARPKPKLSQLGPGLPLGPQWARDANSLEKPALLQSAREKETKLLIQRFGLTTEVGRMNRGPSSLAISPRNAIGDYYRPWEDR